MLDLGKIREEIDATDDEIVRLFQHRMELTSQVAQYKIKTGKPVFDKERETSKLEKLRSEADNEFNAKGIQEIFQQIMSISRKRQYQLLTDHDVNEMSNFIQVDHLDTQGAKVVFQGVEGAYSFAAMKTFFDDSIESFHVDTWKEAMEAISRGEADYAVLPIENSTAGSVLDIYDLLVEYPHYIVGEQIIPAEHVLMAPPGAKLDEIREVCSHPQALSQCRIFLESNEKWKTKEMLNTAVAAKYVAECQDRTKAAIGSRYAAEHFGLQILKEKISNSEGNATRFVIISGKKCFEKNADKISVCIELPHESGTLYNILAHFIYNNLNMTKIESRPIPQKKWEYRFFVDFEGNLSDPAVVNALFGIEQEARKFRLYGNY
ncbi:MAG: prephenate dehydratase [Lachnospiraceae bacterium]|nr:prephenate dehydratase [Lachnospiraceae bacterium]